MYNPKTRIIATNGKTGMDIYLDISGNRCYLASRSFKRLLYDLLKDGKTIGELSRIKPKRSRKTQKIHQYTKYLLEFIDKFYKNDLMF